jgi:Flp pilus assembly protein TadD
MKLPRAHSSLLVCLLLATSCGPIAFAQARHVSCTVLDASQPAPNPAVRLYWVGDSKAAAPKFAELLGEKPNDPELTEGSVRANIELGNVPLAAQLAQSALAAHPDSAAANTAQGEVLFRQGKIPEADKLFAHATQLDPCYAPARLGIARVAYASSMYASAVKAITTAHALNQRDPDIRSLWISTLRGQERIDELTKLRATLDADSPVAQPVTHQIAYYKAALDPANQHPCTLVSSVDSTTIPMQPILWDMTHVEFYGLDTLINGQAARLTLDSGASGLVIGRAFATHAGLKMVEDTQIGGFGDHGAQKSHVAYADDIKIGNLEFHDCRVDVTDRREVVGLSGLVGTDVFRRYLVSVNYPDHLLTLGPLPARPGAHAESTGLDTSGEESEEARDNSSSGTTDAVATGPQDRYIAPEMKDFTPIYRFGHILLIPALVKDIPSGLMVLDTGDGSMMLSYEAARRVTHTRLDTQDTLGGLSGKIEKLSTGGEVTYRFGHGSVKVADVLVVDHSKMSNDIGTEISGFIGYPALHALVFQIDYRDGLVNFIYDPKKDPNRKSPGTECSYCNPGYSQR